MNLKLIISEEEFNQEIFDSKIENSFLIKNHYKISVRKAVSRERYEEFVRKVLHSFLKKKGFHLKKIFFLRGKKWFVCIIEEPLRIKKTYFLDMKLKDFIRYLNKNHLASKRLMLFLKKFQKKHRAVVKVEELFSKYFFLISEESRNNLRVLLEELEANIEMNEQIIKAISLK